MSIIHILIKWVKKGLFIPAFFVGMGMMFAQSGGISYQKLFTHFHDGTQLAPVISLNNIGQVSHTINWNIANIAGNPANTCSNYIQNMSSTSAGYGVDDNLLFMIEGSYDNTNYQRITSVNFPLRFITNNPGYNVNSAPTVTPTLSGTVVGNGNFPYIRAGIVNFTGANSVTNQVFTYCELNAMYIGTTTYIGSADSDSVNNSLNYMYTFSQTANTTGSHSIVGAAPGLSNGAWYDKTYYYVYGVTICVNVSGGTGQSVSIGDAFDVNPKSVQFVNLPVGCMVWPYTGKAYFKVDSSTGMDYTLGIANNTSIFITYRPEAH